MAVGLAVPSVQQSLARALTLAIVDQHVRSTVAHNDVSASCGRWIYNDNSAARLDTGQQPRGT